jgi:hypothetical protein
MSVATIDCPFTYANGEKCQGHIYRARAYGPKRGEFYVTRENVRKYRLWCSIKEDHAGAAHGFEGKERMEFYPDKLPPGAEDMLWSDTNSILS